MAPYPAVLTPSSNARCCSVLSLALLDAPLPRSPSRESIIAFLASCQVSGTSPSALVPGLPLRPAVASGCVASKLRV